MGTLQDAIRDLVDVDAEREGASQRFALHYGTVQTVTPGAALDGRALVSVDIHGSAFAAQYDRDMPTPTSGDIVAVLVVDSQPLIFCRVGGFPSDS